MGELQKKIKAYRFGNDMALSKSVPILDFCGPTQNVGGGGGVVAACMFGMKERMQTHLSVSLSLEIGLAESAHAFN